jgi:Fe-S cluster biogenesis protein NfuA
MYSFSTMSMELNDINVHKVLDEIRPYIEADGGILEYVAIDYLEEGPIVMVRMLGACAGCAMSAQTMTMGIEKLVKERFPEVQRVISV